MLYYTPPHLKTIIESAGVGDHANGSAILLVNPPTIEIVEWLQRRFEVHTLHFSSDEVYQTIGRAGDMTVATARRFNRVLLRADPTHYLSACPPQCYSLIIWFDAQKTPNAQMAFTAGKRATAFNGQQIILTPESVVIGLPDIRTMEFTGAGTPLMIHVWDKEPGFLIASYPRCGTHMLRTALGKHPDVTCYTEVFNPTVADGSHRLPTARHVTETFWTRPLDGIIGHAYIGVSGGVAGMTSPRVYQHLWAELPRDLKVISMRRRDLLARHVSHLKAKQTTIWNRENGKPGTNNHAVTVNVNKLYEDALFVKKCWQLIDNRYPGRLVVFYEDLLTNFQRELDRVQRYLNLLPIECTPDTHKLGRTLQQDISNYDEVMEGIKHHGKGLLQYEA